MHTVSAKHIDIVSSYRIDLQEKSTAKAFKTPTTMLSRHFFTRRYHPSHRLLYNHHPRHSLSTTTTTTTSNTTSIRLYRILLRMTRSLLNDNLPLQQPLDPRDYGQARLTNSTVTNNNTGVELYKLFTKWHVHDLDDPDVIRTWYSAVSDLPFYDFDEDENDNDNMEPCCSSSLWASRDDIQQAITRAFRQAPTDDVLTMQRLAMKAIQDVQQQHFLQQHSSVSIDTKRGVRVVATSSCIGTSSTGIQDAGAAGLNVKYRFAYRMRVENLQSSSQTIQLLGRSWRIQDTSPTGEPIGEAQHVFAPTTGAVGHLPVLQPGHVFEYMSGCELFTKHGTMSGAFHMATVPDTTKSGMIGDSVHVFEQENPDLWELPVHEFPLNATDE